jgi:hypothetical protein
MTALVLIKIHTIRTSATVNLIKFIRD